MTRYRSILFFLGIEGQLYLLDAVRRRFGVSVAGVVLTQHMQTRIATSAIGRPDRLYSFPDYYRQHAGEVAARDSNAIRDRIADLERRWRIDATTTFVYFDRYLRQCRDYRRMIELMVLYMEFCAHILEREDPVWVRSNVTTFVGTVMQEACLGLGIPALKQRTATVGGRMAFSDETCNGNMRGWRRCYEAASTGRTSPDVVAAAGTWLNAFRDRPKRPAYAERNSLVSFNAGRFARHLWHGFAVRFSRSYWDNLLNSSLDRALYLRLPPGSAFLKDFLWREVRAAWLRRGRLYRDQVDLDEPFIYLPIQRTPEISTLVHGLEYEDALELVARAAKFCPAGYRIYVKEHTSMVGRRPLSAYREMRQFHNVTLVPPTVNTFDLIRRSKAVMTVTSTAGWEAFLLGKPVLVLGHVFYQEFPNVLKVALNEVGTGRIRDYMDNFQPDEAAIRAAVIAYFDCSYACTTGDIGIDIAREDAAQNAELIVDAIVDQLARFPLPHAASERRAAVSGSS